MLCHKKEDPIQTYHLLLVSTTSQLAHMFTNPILSHAPSSILSN